MTLLDIITGQSDEGNPILEGTDSALFTNLSREDLQRIQKTLDASG
jgi:hypothetical protein